MRRLPLVLAAVATLAAPVATVAPQDLVTNGHFDGDIEGWKIVQGVGTEAWDPFDFQGNPASGSLRLSDNGAGTAVVVSGQCIELQPSETYEVGSHIRFVVAAAAGFGQVVVGWFDNPCCVGVPVAVDHTPPVPSTVGETWIESFTAGLGAPPGTVAAGVGLAVAKLGAEGSVGSGIDARLSWPGSPACPGPTRPAAPPSAHELVAGGPLDALFDRVRFGHTGTTPVRAFGFTVE